MESSIDGNEDGLGGVAPQQRRKRRRKNAKDPNAPKRPLNSYFLFKNEYTPFLKKREPGLSFGGMSTRLGQLWATIDSDTKDKYKRRAAAEKLRYQTAMVEYNSKGNIFQNEKGAGKTKRLKRYERILKIKEQKRPLSAFVLFSNEYHPLVRERNPDIRLPEIAMQLGQIWAKMDRDTKMLYQCLADQETINYYKGLVESYRKIERERKRTIKAKEIRRKRDPNLPKRPLNKFILFYKDNWPLARMTMPSGSQVPAIAKTIATMWASTTPDVKSNYDDTACKERINYRKALEIYKTNLGMGLMNIYETLMNNNTVAAKTTTTPQMEMKKFSDIQLKSVKVEPLDSPQKPEMPKKPTPPRAPFYFFLQDVEGNRVKSLQKRNCSVKRNY